MEEKHVYLGIKVTLVLLGLTFFLFLASIFSSTLFLLSLICLLLTIFANIITSTLAYQLMAKDKMDYGTSLVYGFVVYFLGILGVWFYLKQRAKTK